jgi:Ca2+-transporting ATPase
MHLIKDILVKGMVLFIAVNSVYFYACFQNLSLIQSQTFAFAAWIFGHIVLAFISRSDQESIFSLGIFTNKIINLWAIAAIIFLALGIYLPFLKDRLNLFSISPTQLIFVAITVSLMVSVLELSKIFYLNKKRKNALN